MESIWEYNKIPKNIRLFKTPDNMELNLSYAGKKGGEGLLYHIDNIKDHGFITKIYKRKEIADKKEDKISAMIKLIKDGKCDVNTLKFISKFTAFPRARLYNQKNEFVGYIMNYFNLESSSSLAEFIEGKYRVYNDPNAWILKLYVCINLLKIFSLAHSLGIIIVDGHPNNFFLRKDTRIIWLDCDSAQITFGKNKFAPDAVFQSIVAPEIIKKGKVNIKTDSFVLGILIYRILMKGFTPFQFIDKKQETFDQIIYSCKSPLRNNELKLPPGCPELKLLGPLKEVIEMCISPNSLRRPGVRKIYLGLSALIENTCVCKEGHPTPSYLDKCIICGANLNKKTKGIFSVIKKGIR